MKQLLIFLTFTLTTFSVEYKPIVLDPTYEHDKWITLPTDQVRKFGAYTVSFDGEDDNDGDNDADKWGIPEWVSFEIKGDKEKHKLEKRPSSWITDKELEGKGLAPKDSTYAVSGTRKLKEVKTDYRFVRGHMCPKDTAERISADAAFNTHTVLNAVPQLQWQNNEIWKALEEECIRWADKHKRVWVTCGPVFFNKQPALWLGQDGEKQVAVPDAIFKIVSRESSQGLEAMAFLIPNIIPKGNGKNDLKSFLVDVDRLEALTGLDFFTALPDEKEKELESRKADKIWKW